MQRAEILLWPHTWQCYFMCCSIPVHTCIWMLFDGSLGFRLCDLTHYDNTTTLIHFMHGIHTGVYIHNINVTQPKVITTKNSQQSLNSSHLYWVSYATLSHTSHHHQLVVRKDSCATVVSWYCHVADYCPGVSGWVVHVDSCSELGIWISPAKSEQSTLNGNTSSASDWWCSDSVPHTSSGSESWLEEGMYETGVHRLGVMAEWQNIHPITTDCWWRTPHWLGKISSFGPLVTLGVHDFNCLHIFSITCYPSSHNQECSGT